MKKALALTSITLIFASSALSAPLVCRNVVKMAPASKALKDSEFAEIRSTALKVLLANVGLHENQRAGEHWNRITGEANDVQRGLFDLDGSNSQRLAEWIENRKMAEAQTFAHKLEQDFDLSASATKKLFSKMLEDTKRALAQAGKIHDEAMTSAKAKKMMALIQSKIKDNPPADMARADFTEADIRLIMEVAESDFRLGYEGELLKIRVRILEGVVANMP